MRIAGVICEYNPFHKGHALHLRTVRSILGEDAGIVAVMSGDFVQRGEAAVFDKFIRSAAAVAGGADLVLELPLPWCLASAEGFARGGVGLLNSAGIVDTISFGSECGHLSALEETASLLLRPEIGELTRSILRAEGISYPAARQKALESLYGKEKSACLVSPNDILAVEYIKAVRQQRADFAILPVRRKGSVHDAAGSAAEIRRLWQQGREVLPLLPGAAAEVYSRAAKEHKGPVFPSAFRLPAVSRLRMLRMADFAALPDAAEGIENRLFSAAKSAVSPEEVAEKARSRRYTLSRLRRMTMCAVLGIQKEDSLGIPPYIRPLALNEKGQEMLRQMRKKALVPIITKTAHIREESNEAQRIFSLGASAHDFYVLAYSDPAVQYGGEDYRFSVRPQKNACIFS